MRILQYSSIYLLILIHLLCVGYSSEGFFGSLWFVWSAEEKIHFNLFTPENPTEPFRVNLRNISKIRESNFNDSLPTRCYTTGWYREASAIDNVLIRDAYLQKGNFNVIIVDWHEGSGTYFYLAPALNVKIVAKIFAKFLKYLVDEMSLNLTTLYLIGYSLGAHISGLTGQYFQEQKISAIMGLDPAGLPYHFLPDKERLSRGDANYIQILHTTKGMPGLFTSIGDADFYANGGISQPGCAPTIKKYCDHYRPFQYFAESINSTVGFYSCRIESNKQVCGDFLMGGEPLQIYKGDFYFNTSAEEPFALGCNW